MLKKLISILAFCLLGGTISAQLLTTIPSFPQDNIPISIIVDCSKGNQGLFNYSNTTDVYVHIGVITNLSTSPSDWKYVRFTWGTTDPAARAALIATNQYQYNIANLRSFLGVPANETILRIAILFRNGSGSQVQRNADGTDMFIKIYDNNAAASKFLLPPYEPKYNPTPEPISITIPATLNAKYVSNQTGTLKLFYNGASAGTVSGDTILQSSVVVNSSGSQQIVGQFTNGSITLSDTINFFVPPPVNIAPLPPGVRDGINYLPNDSSVILVLFAPNKNKVSVIGDFNNWIEQTNTQMNRTPDGTHFWVQVDGLTPGQEYAYQYIIDDNIKVADYYTEKILDPDNDPSIPASTYPNLKAYPTGKTTGIVSVLQTRAPKYNWRNTNFARPDKKNLVIYELLVRDFVAAHDFKTLRDTLSYLKRLGVNAIELMPVSEFGGNSSWGYNPSFYFAPDKYYGPANTLREFIDSCHNNGIAVILDMVLNHSHDPSPMARMYFDAVNNRPAVNNPWFNPVAPHAAISFGYDFNHESDATKYFVDRVVEHWLLNYKFDGFRFDFTKGFTQKQTTTDAALSAYDSSRVKILRRIYDSIQSKSPNAYMIIEHFCDNTEETDLANAGMMPWGNLNYNFNEATMGWVSTSNFEWGLYTKRGYAQPHLVTYMESHDEERLMYKNIKYGNASGSYTTRDTAIALRRDEMAAAFYFCMPGPKMIWEFGELGYDYSRCYQSTNGEGGDCNKKLDPKPIRWDYQLDLGRKRQFEIYAALIKLKKQFPNTFTAATVNSNLTSGFKSIQLTHADLSVTVIGNFDVSSVNGSVTFQNSGTWYNYLTGEPFSETGGAQNFTLAPGEYKLLVNKNVVNAVVTAVSDVLSNSNNLEMLVYPNPASTSSQLVFSSTSIHSWVASITDVQGRIIAFKSIGTLVAGKHQFILGNIFPVAGILSKGVYYLTLSAGNETRTMKIIL
jgi:1,4-alpha-glucan branching enzyme